MKNISLKQINRGFVWVLLLVLVVIIMVLLKNSAVSLPKSSDYSTLQSLPASKQLAPNLNTSFAPGADQPPGLTSAPPSEAPPPEDIPLYTDPVNPDTQSNDYNPSEPAPIYDDPVILPTPTKPKIQECPMFDSGADSNYYTQKCGTCRQPLTAGDVYPCDKYD